MQTNGMQPEHNHIIKPFGFLGAKFIGNHKAATANKIHVIVSTILAFSIALAIFPNGIAKKVYAIHGDMDIFFALFIAALAIMNWKLYQIIMTNSRYLR